MTGKEPDAKVMFWVKNEDGSVNVETLWACDLGGDNYRLDNSPFYAHSISWQDIVHAPYDKDECFPLFERVVEKSGNRTLRIIFDPPVEDGNESDRVLQGLVAKGCSYEGASRSYMAINIPPNVELEGIRRYLVEREANREHADPSYDELFPDEN